MKGMVRPVSAATVKASILARRPASGGPDVHSKSNDVLESTRQFAWPWGRSHGTEDGEDAHPADEGGDDDYEEEIANAREAAAAA